MRRCAISFIFDPDGIVDDYIAYLLKSLKPHVERIVFVVNGALDDPSRNKMVDIADEIIVRENKGFDVWAYKTGLEHIWTTQPDRFDEIIMFNHTFYGPLYPISELFEAMGSAACDFWGVTAHAEEVEKGPHGERRVPFHLNSHFIAVREPLLSSTHFRDYWLNMPMINSYWESIELHELRFTQHFKALGFRAAAYVDPAKFGSAYAAFMEIDATVAARSPILKRRAFFHDSMFIEERAVDLPRALRIVESRTNYDTSLIWKNILRSTPARIVNTNTARWRVLPDLPSPGFAAATEFKPKIALCIHAYYDELIDELLDFSTHIPLPFDLIVTTNTAAKKKRIEASAKRHKSGQVIVRLWTERGRDMSALAVACADLFGDDRYDLVCRVHTKKAPQVAAARGNFFKRFVLENVLNSRGYVEHILDLFRTERQLGVVMPPMMHISVPTLGHAWFTNKEKAAALAARLKLKVPLDDNPPIAVYGGMFWFRPKALRKLFTAGLKYEDFEPEPLPIDGALPHALERIIVYVAQDAGYYSMAVAAANHIAYAYGMLEYKANEMAKRLPTGDFRRQIELLDQVRPVLAAAHFGEPVKPAGYEQMIVSEAHANRLERDIATLEHRTKYLKTRLRNMSGSEPKRVPVRLAMIGAPGSLRRELSIILEFVNKLRGFGVHFDLPTDKAVFDYIHHGHLEGNELIPLFDSEFYLDTSPDLGGAGVNPLAHFIEHGWLEGRTPHPLIDLKFTRERQPEYLKAQDIPLADLYAGDGRRAISSHPLFDASYYLMQMDANDLRELSTVEHYLRFGADKNLNPHPLFDTRYYKENSSEFVRFAANPLAHYIRFGATEGRLPSKGFDGAAYLYNNPDVRRAKMNPLVHYVLCGQFEGRKW